MLLTLPFGGSVQAQIAPAGLEAPPDRPRTPRVTRAERRQLRAIEKAARQEQKKREADAKVVENNHGGTKGRMLSPQESEAAEALFIDGVKLLTLDDPNRALEKLVKAWQIDPTNAAVNYKLAETASKLNQVGEAIAYGKAAVRLEPKNPYYYLLLSQLYAGQQQYDDAADVYAGLLREVPDADQYLPQLADLYVAAAKLDQALAALEKAEKRYGVSEETALKRQQIYLRKNDFPKAVTAGEDLIRANPSEVRYVLALASLYLANNLNAKALEQIERALQTAPNHPQALLLRSDLRRAKNDSTGAEADVRQAFRSPELDIDARVRIMIEFIKRLPSVESARKPTATQEKRRQNALELATLTIQNYPDEPKSYAVMGDLQALSGQKKEARASYLQAVRRDNSKFRLWQQIVLLDAELDQTDSLLRHSERALRLFPNQPLLYFYNGSALLLRKDYEQAARTFEYGRKMVADEPELRQQFEAQLGNTYEYLKQYDKSAAAYEAALALNPDDATVLNNYSYYLSVRGAHLDKAATMTARLLQLFPGNGTYLDTRAWVLYKQGQYEAARELLERALRDRQDPDILEHYGDVLWKLNRPAEALINWQRARQLMHEPSENLDRKIQNKTFYE